MQWLAANTAMQHRLANDVQCAYLDSGSVRSWEPTATDHNIWCQAVQGGSRSLGGRGGMR